jgi:hypothetical protein
MSTSVKSASVVVGILSCATSLSAGMLVVDGYSQIKGARFYDAPASDILSPVNLNCTLDHLNCVTITTGSTSLNESFSGVNVPQYGPDVPGDGAGFGSDSTGFGARVNHTEVQRTRGGVRCNVHAFL